MTEASEMIEVPFNDLLRRYKMHADEIETTVLETLRSGRWLNGSKAHEFSEQFSKYLGVVHCITVGNGTDALELIVRAISASRENRREVVTTANSGGYSTAAIRAAGLTPVYADVVRETQLIAISSVVDCLSEDTAAVIATHLYGGVVDIPALRSALKHAGRSDVVIIEDCAQSHGARLGKCLTGSLGDIGAFSFYPTKNLGAVGDAGAIVTSDDNLAAKVRRLHQYGWSSKYEVACEGGRNSRMDELQAAVLSAALPYLETANQERARILARYKSAAPPSVRFIERRNGAIVHLAVVLSESRDRLRAFLKKRNIATEVHYPILDCVQEGWKARTFRIAPGGLPESARGVQQVLSLPCFVGITDAEIDHVAKSLNEFPGL